MTGPEYTGRLLVTGAAGQLGTDVRRVAEQRGHEVIGLARHDLDITEGERIEAALDTFRPAVLINAAAYTRVDAAEENLDAAFLANMVGPRLLAAACAARGIPLIHYSTDYVFGGSGQKTPYTESDQPMPVNVYGASKLAGEHFVRGASPRNLVVRTSGVFGPAGSRGMNFVETMLRLGARGTPVRVVHDQRASPTYTDDLASKVLDLVDAGTSGLIHVTNDGDCTWIELAQAVFRLARMDVDIVPITTGEFGASAPRPAYSVLSRSRLASLGLDDMRAWQEALADYLLKRPA